MSPQRELSHVVKSGFLADHSIGAGDITEPRPCSDLLAVVLVGRVEPRERRDREY